MLAALFAMTLAHAQPPAPATIVCKGNEGKAQLTLTATHLKIKYKGQGEVKLSVQRRHVEGAGASARTVVDLERGSIFSYFDQFGCPKEVDLVLPDDLMKVDGLSCTRKGTPPC